MSKTQTLFDLFNNTSPSTYTNKSLPIVSLTVYALCALSLRTHKPLNNHDIARIVLNMHPNVNTSHKTVASIKSRPKGRLNYFLTHLPTDIADTDLTYNHPDVVQTYNDAVAAFPSL